ncbi:C-C motif chemokine 4 [Brachyhypopomus gauderio]|uniref:C-C motif chemokine 4 n=1 Tax=Brachyhypopomus gauderio TaxID=698409 RepID=UPI0040423B67
MTRLCLVVSALLVLLCVWVSLGETSLLGCCTNFSPHPLHVSRVRDFKVQDVTTTCRLHAVIFFTVRDRKICADPDAPWVKHTISYLLARRRSSLKNPHHLKTKPSEDLSPPNNWSLRPL